MTKIRNAIDLKFAQLGNIVVNVKWIVFAFCILLTAFMASRLPLIEFDMSNEAFLRKDDPSIIRYEAYRDQFGRDEMILIMIKPKNVFDVDFLTKLVSFHNELEENVPFLNDITSLVNARSTTGTEGELLVEDLLENFPETREDLTKLKQTVLSNPFYRDLLISEDGALTTIVIKSDAYTQDSEPEFASGTQQNAQDLFTVEHIGSDIQLKPLSDEENSKIVQKVREIMEKYNSPDFPLYLSGSPVVTDFLKRSMQKDMAKFTIVAILAIAAFLFLLFRRLSGVVFPLVTVVLSVIYTFALMALTGTSLKVPLVILPSFLLAIGIGASVHLMAIFYKHFDGANKPTAISKALEHSGLPIVMASLTTSAGLASFSQAELLPAADLGIFAAIGVLISLCFTIILAPAMIAIFPSKSVKERPEKTEKINRMDQLLKSCGDLAVDNRFKVAIVSLILIIVGVIGILRLEVTHHILYWFPKGTEIRDNTELIDKNMNGSVALEVVLDTKKENGLHEPDFLNRLERIEKAILNYVPESDTIKIRKTVSLNDILKETNQALNENQPEYYSVPQDRVLIAQELLLFENSGSDDLEDLVDSQFSKTHLSIKVPWSDSVSYVHFLDYVNKNIAEIFDDDVEIYVTGIVEIMMMTVYAMMKSTLKSYGIAIIVITFLMIILIGKLRIGLLSMIPNLTPIILTLGIMGWLGINLDMFSMLIGSIAMGLAVDDTIHFFHNFRKYYDATGKVRTAVEQTLTSAGRAMLVTTLVLTTGFWLFMFATLKNLFYFGFLTGITLIFAFLADIIIAPALVAIVTKDKN